MQQLLAENLARLQRTAMQAEVAYNYGQGLNEHEYETLPFSELCVRPGLSSA